MSEMQATWRRPTSAARPGAQASPPPRPAPPETPRPQAFPSFRAPTAPAPGPRRGGRGSLGNPQAGRAGRRAGCGAFCAERPCRPVRLPRAIPSAPIASGTPVSVPTLLSTPQRLWTPPGPPGSLGRIPLRGRPPEPRGSERYPRRRPAPGVRPSVPAGRGAKGRGSRRGPWVPATPTLSSPAPERREPRAPNGRRTRPGPSRRHRRKGTPRRRQHAAPAAASGPHLRPLLLAFPSARRNAANFLKTKMFSPRDTHERDERDTTMRALRLRNANWPRATLLSAETHLPRRRGGCNGCAERGETLKRQNDIQLQIVSK